MPTPGKYSVVFLVQFRLALLGPLLLLFLRELLGWLLRLLREGCVHGRVAHHRHGVVFVGDGRQRGAWRGRRFFLGFLLLTGAFRPLFGGRAEVLPYPVDFPALVLLTTIESFLLLAQVFQFLELLQLNTFLLSLLPAQRFHCSIMFSLALFLLFHLRAHFLQILHSLHLHILQLILIISQLFELPFLILLPFLGLFYLGSQSVELRTPLVLAAGQSVTVSSKQVQVFGGL
mmetsp:Transcript_58692/g.155213  ORF Transcript_58692/g.155213 Transcript_58692/m.155213 type:complete len:231 (-) Transcript_58692:4576-5268(-)